MPVTDTVRDLIRDCSKDQPSYQQLIALFSEQTKETHSNSDFILKNIKDVIFQTDEDGCFAFLSTAWENISGYTVAESIGRSVADFVVPDDRQYISNLCDSLLCGDRESCHQELRCTRRDGGLRYLEVQAHGVFDDTRQIMGVVGIIRDISERHVWQRRLDESQERYRLLADHIHDLISVHNPDGSLRYVSPSSERMLGYKPEELALASMPRNSLVHPDDIPIVLDQLEEVRQEQGHIARKIYRLRHRNGHYIWVESDLNAVFHQDGSLDCFVTSTRDVSERIQAEAKLRQHRRNLQALIENTDGSIWSVDGEYRLIAANSVFHQKTAHALGHAINPGDDIFLNDMPQSYKAIWRGCYDRALAGERFTIEISREGLRQSEFHFNPIVDESGEIIGVTVYGRDISQRKRIEENLHRYRRMVSSSTDGISLVDRNYVYLIVNDRYLERSGRKRSEVEGHSVAEVVGEDYFNTSVKPRYDRAFTGEIVKHEAWYEVADLGRRYLTITYSPYYDDDGQIVGVILNSRDITEKKVSDEALARSEALLRESQAISHLGSWEVNLDNGVTRWSDEFYRICGFEPEAVVPTTELGFSLIYPDDVPLATAAFEETQRDNRPYSIEKRIIRPNGEIRWVKSQGEVITDPITAQRKLVGTFLDITERKKAEEAMRRSQLLYENLANSVTDVFFAMDSDFCYIFWNPASEKYTGIAADQALGRSLYDLFPNIQNTETDFMYRRVLRDQTPETIETVYFVNGAVRNLEIRAYPSAQGIAVLVRDITDRHLTRKREFELALERERMHLLTSFVQGAAHEFRTPLTIISTSNYLMQRATDPDYRNRKIEQVQAQVERLTRLVDALLLMSKLEMSDSSILRRAPVDINLLAHDVCEVYRNQNCLKVSLHFIEQLALPVTLGDTDYLREALSQILDNACRFTPQDGEVTVIVGADEDNVWIEVNDTGPGIDEASLERVFDTFWRQDSNRTMPGFGLGLSIAQRVVERHSGRISVKSRVGDGTRVRIMLPIVRELA